MKNNFEKPYANTLRELLNQGIVFNNWETNRTAQRSCAMHKSFFLQDIENNFPIIKCKKVLPLNSLKETIWILLGKNDLQWLNDRGVHYWNKWRITESDTQFDKKYQDTIGLSYGTQARNFNNVDNWKELINETLKNPKSRRLILSLWDPSTLNETKLPPCLVMFIFTCKEIDLNKPDLGYYVNMDTILRSNDAFLGCPYDFMMSAFIMKIFCLQLNYSINAANFFIPNDLYYTAVNFHIYENQIDSIKEYLFNYDDDFSHEESLTAQGTCQIDLNFRGIKNKSDDFIVNLADELDSHFYENVKISKNYCDRYPFVKCDVVE
jgi:thymidylate synthase